MPTDIKAAQVKKLVDELALMHAKVELVLDAIVEAAKNQNDSSVIHLHRTKENSLTGLSRHEIIETIEKLIIPTYGTFIIIDSDNSNAAAPIKLSVRRGLEKDFDNWCESWLHRKSVSLKTLSKEGYEKIHETILAIDGEFEFTGNPRLTIKSIDGNPTQDAKARSLSLKFLSDKGVVNDYEFKGNFIAVELNIKKFLKFKDLFPTNFKSKSKDGGGDVRQTKLNKSAMIPKLNKGLNKPAYCLSLSPNGEILINNVLLTRPHPDGENDIFFRYLIKYPKKKITREILKRENAGVGKDLWKIVQNLGFTHAYLKAFFPILKKETLVFRNPVTNKDLEGLRLKGLPYPSKSRRS